MSDALMKTDSSLVQINTEQVEAVTKPEEVEGATSDTLTDTIVPTQEPDTEMVSALAQDDGEPGLGNGAVAEKETATVPADESTETMPIEAVATTEAHKKPVIDTWQPRSLSKPVLIMIWILFVLSLTGTVVSAVAAFNYGVDAYTTYVTIRNRASSGMQHVLRVKTIFTGANTHLASFLDVSKLRRAQTELVAAHEDFQQMQYTLDHGDVIANVREYLPQYRSQLTAARAASQMGIDVAEIGQELVKAAIILAPTFHGPVLTNARKPLVTPAMLALVGTTIDDVLPRLNDIQIQGRLFSPDTLPLSAYQREQLIQVMQTLPQAQADLMRVRGLLNAAGWMLGVDEPRTFLIQTMDRAELRPTGGFTGQFGELSISGGRVAPFSLKDISLVEYADNSPTQGLLAPPQYRSWWPFANWGLRDSNLSADFPTSAQIAIDKYKSEVHHSVDGVILFTPFLIEHILEVVGPISVPGYNDTITARNLEERLHYYQQDSEGLAKQVIYQPGDKNTSSRKRFTALLAQLLMDKVRHASPDEIIAIARQMLHDLKTKDLQIYMTNPQVEGLLIQNGDAAQMDLSTTHDGLYVVQANVSASKASQFVRTIMHDTVTLDAHGGVTHVLQLRLVYSQAGPVYGYDTYRDYVRVYVPPSSQFLWGDGFDTGQPLCGAWVGDCPQSHVYPGDELVCPLGQYQPGAQAPSIKDEDGGHWHPLDTVGPPSNRSSDEPGRAMYGGWVIVPKNCTMTVTLSWYVPPLSEKNYSLLIQRQAGTFPEMDVTVLPAPGSCMAGKYFNGVLGEDVSLSLKTSPALSKRSANCYPQPGL
jgi:Protein of unknown function (DUF4012)